MVHRNAIFITVHCTVIIIVQCTVMFVKMAAMPNFIDFILLDML